MENVNVDKILDSRRWLMIAHHIPGRIRLRFTNQLVGMLAKNKLFLLETFTKKIEALHSYTIHPESHSVLLEYDSNHIPPELLNQLFNHDDVLARQALNTLFSLATFNKDY